MSKNDISAEDEELFRQAMQTVKPLKKITRKAPISTKVSLPQVDSMKNNNSCFEVFSSAYLIPLSDQYNTPVQAETLLSYNPYAIPTRHFKQFKAGNIPMQSCLDLHGLKPEPARETLCKFLYNQTIEGRRCLLIIHGKGGQHGEAPILKNLVNHWLKQFPQVLAFHSAMPKDGGAGAIYVLLKKKSL